MSKFVCGQTHVITLEETEKGAIVRKIPLKCKSWTCDKCRVKKAKKYSERTFRLFQGVPHVRFLTVTFDRSRSLRETWEFAPVAWNRFRTAFTKKYGKTRFVRVVEPQKDGYPHYHILLDRYIPAGWLTRELKSAGFGPIRDIQLISSRDGFYYVLKYLRKKWRKTKADEILKYLTVRRYSSSRSDNDDGRPERRMGLISFAGSSECADLQMEKITQILAKEGFAYAGRDGPNSIIYYSFGNFHPDRYCGLSQISRIYPEVVDLRTCVLREFHGIMRAPLNLKPGALPWHRLAWKAYARGRLA